MEDLTYLVMTAADCAEFNKTNPHSIVSLNQLLDERATSVGDQLCVGFSTRQEDGSFACETFSACSVRTDLVCVFLRA